MPPRAECRTPTGLVKQFPLIHIRDEDHLDEALEVFNGLLLQDRD
jgi:hypothetical protein